ncbi:hypothetical protein G7046_g4270 [Stylonectria norvegica]|nr:hypothetical protein G7046_g4270 [Stylonectria norvegica]
MKKSTSLPASLGDRMTAGILSKFRDADDSNVPRSQNVLTKEPKPESKLVKWTKAELRGKGPASGDQALGEVIGTPLNNVLTNKDRFMPTSMPKSWAKLTDSELFNFKGKSDSERANRRSVPNAETAPKSTRSHRHSKSEIVDRTEDGDALRRELRELAAKHNHIKRVPVRDGAQRTVTQVFRGSPILEDYAHSAEIGINRQRLRLASELEASLKQIKEGRSSDESSEEYFECHENKEYSVSSERENIDVPPTPIDANSSLIGTDQDIADGSQPRLMSARQTSSMTSSTLTDTTLHKEFWGSNDSGLIDENADSDTAQVPKCTASGHEKRWRITQSMLKAYNAMRGPKALAGRDLSVWMDRCRRWIDKPKERNEQLDLCDSSIDDSESLRSKGSPPLQWLGKKEVFFVPRPPYKHIAATSNPDSTEQDEPVIEIPMALVKQLKREAMRESGMGLEDGFGEMPDWSSEEDGVEDWDESFIISDDEDDPLDGRISPCTFRLWAEGCKRWDQDKIIIDPVPETELHHLESRGSAEHHASCDHRAEREYTFQYDTATDGGLMSGEYQVSEDPSMKWTPSESEPPVRTMEWQRSLSDRMSGTEVLSALNAEDAPFVGGIPPHEAEAELLQRHETLGKCLSAERKATLGIAAAEEGIAHYQAQLERVSASVNALLDKRAQEKARRQRQIYRRVSQHLKEIQELSDAKHSQAWDMTLRLAALMAQERDLAKKVVLQARQVGVVEENPEMVERALLQLMMGEAADGGDDVRVYDGDDDEDDCSFF